MFYGKIYLGGDYMEGNYFKAEEKYAPRSSNDNFFLHSHSEYEIYLFLEGDSNCIVEDKTYPLSPGDMLIIRKNQMHRVYHNKKTAYKRFILMVSPDFFEMDSCREYEKVFLDSTFDESNKINSEIVKSSGLYDAYVRLKTYTNDFENQDLPIAKAIVTEILYLISKISSLEPPIKGSRLIKNVIAYINLNIKKDLSLERLSSEFFVSKYHLCHSFKKNTGLTIKEYIDQKRLSKANEYIAEGSCLSDAANRAGFKDYSSFYRCFVKNNKENPSKIKKQR